MPVRKPNVMVIMADDLGYGDLGCFGNIHIQSPNIDRLAASGVKLTQHYTSSPLCAPARGGFLSGCYNHRVGALSVESNRGLDRISLKYKTMADHFKAGGYATGMVGKWHSGLFNMRYHPNNRGFEEFVGFLNGGMDYYDWILDYNGQPVRSDGRYLTDVLTAEAVSYIDRHKDHPFFLYLAYNAPHSPLQAPEEDVKLFEEKGIFNRGVSTLYGMIRRMDAGIGKILDVLEKQGLFENTIILVTSDNGPWLGQDSSGYNMTRFNGPFRGQKQDVLEGGIRVPAVVHWPAGLRGERDIHEMVHFCDWMPTLLGSCGIYADDTDGRDMMKVLNGDIESCGRKRFWQFNRYEPVMNCNAAMRDGDWKLYWPRIPEAMMKRPEDDIWYQRLFDEPHFKIPLPDTHFIERTVSAPGKPQLYNLREDFHEDKNLADIYPERLASMVYELENWFEQIEFDRRKLPEYNDRIH